MKKMLTLVLACVLLVASISACFAEETLDLRALTMDEILAGAKEEGCVETVGMPDEWAIGI